MANTAIMEETATRRDERREDRRTAAEQEHTNRISENYRKLLFDNSETWATASAENETHAVSYSAPATATATLERTPVMPVHESVAPAEPAEKEQAQDFSANTAHRLADYVAYAPAQGKRMLFEGLAYKNGELIDTRAAAAAPAAAPAPVFAAAAPAVAPAPVFAAAAPAVAPAPVFTPAAPAYAPAPAPVQAPAAPAVKPSEDDALPTRRTLDTLQRGAEMTQTDAQTRTGLLAALSLKTKLVLCAIAATIVLIIALICVNTGILSAANAEIVVKEAQLRDLQSQYAQMQEELNYLQSDEYIDAWAQQNGMVRGE